MPDYTTRRTMMVDTQVRPSDVTKFPIINAMLGVEREAFVPGGLREAAYMSENIDLGDGIVLLEPRTLAKMLEVLDISGGELVLDIGSGYGYSAAVIARMAEAVVAVDPDALRSEEAQSALSDAGADNVIVHTGPLAEGAAQHGPYDAIIIQGGVVEVPGAVLDQVKEGGRIACLFMEGALGVVRVGYKFNDKMNWRFAFNASAPVLDGFEKTKTFAF